MKWRLTGDLETTKAAKKFVKGIQERGRDLADMRNLKKTDLKDLIKGDLKKRTSD